MSPIAWRIWHALRWPLMWLDGLVARVRKAIRRVARPDEWSERDAVLLLSFRQ